MVKRKATPVRRTSPNRRKAGGKASPRKSRPTNQMAIGTKQFKIFSFYQQAKACWKIVNFERNKNYSFFNLNTRSTLKEIRRLQSTVASCIPRLPFSRLIREILMEHGRPDQRIQIEALKALQEAAEIYLTYLFEDANKCALHARRVTVMPKDMNLVLDLRGCTDPGFS